MAQTNRKSAGKKAKPVDPPAEPQPPVYDPAAGKAAFEALLPRMNALRDDEIISTRLDIEAAVMAGLAVYAFATSPALYARYKKLHEIGEFDIEDLDGLKDSGFAVLYALSEARIAGALETTAQLPASLVTRAREVEGRMQGLSEYHFRKDPVISKELDRLSPGSDHRDLANDLLGYARIYEIRADIVAADPTNYVPTDKAEAEQIAGKMLALLAAAASPKQRAAREKLVRAWTVFNHRYDPVAITGEFLMRNDPKQKERFPSLFTAGRPGGGRPKKKAKPTGGRGEGQGGEG